MKKLLVLSITHLLFAFAGFAVGIYLLPILIAPDAPAMADIQTAANTADFKTTFRRDLEGSDLLHWGEGKVSISQRNISLAGKLAPGPDYKLYLSPEFVETKAAFEQLKHQMVQLGSVKTFNNFIVPVPVGIKPENFNTVVIWCETFGAFITAGKYQ